MERGDILYGLQQLVFWKTHRTECFNNLLFDLIAKADGNNKGKLGVEFPEFVFAFDFWVEQGIEGTREQIKKMKKAE